MVTNILCPLCGSPMHQDGKYYQCTSNQLHKCHIDKEWKMYTTSEKDISWLRFRMKVRLGKLAHKR